MNKKPPRHPDEVEKILIFKVYNSNMKSFAKILKIMSDKNFNDYNANLYIIVHIYNNIFFYVK